MSATGERFAKIPEAMIKDHTLGHAAFRVYAALFCRANWDDTWTHIGEDALGEDLGLCRAAVATQIGALVARGYLEVQRRQGCRNKYRMVLNPSSQLTASNEVPVNSLDATRQAALQESSTHLTQPVNPLDTVPDFFPDLLPDSFPEVVVAPPTAAKKTRSRKVVVPIDDAYLDQLVEEFAPKLGGAEQVRKQIARALNHRALNQANDQRLRLRHWLEDDAERGTGGGHASIRPRQDAAIHAGRNAANHSAARGGHAAANESGGGSDPFAAFSRPERFSRLAVVPDLSGRGEGNAQRSGEPSGLWEGNGLHGVQRGERAEVEALVHA